MNRELGARPFLERVGAKSREPVEKVPAPQHCLIQTHLEINTISTLYKLLFFILQINYTHNLAAI